MLGENTTAGWRTELWVRCEGMGEGLRRLHASQRALSESDIEDLWSALLARLVQAPGPNTLPAGADRWPDKQLRGFLNTALEREVWRAARRNVTDGVLRSTPLDGLSEGTHERGLLSRDAAPAGPESEVFGRLDALEYAKGIEHVAGPEATRLMLADAMGASAREQRDLLGIAERGPYRTLRGRLEMAGNAMSRRLQSVVAWFLPDSVLRWLGPLASSGPVPRIGVIGLLLAALAAGGAGVTSATHHESPAPPRSLAPITSRAVVRQLNAAGAPLAAVVASRQAAGGVAARAHAKAKAKAQTQRRSAARRRAWHRAKAAAASAADHQFSGTAITASPASASVRPRGSAPKVTGGDKANADSQFGLGG